MQNLGFLGNGVGWDGVFLINVFRDFLPFYTHDGQRQNRAHHGYILDVGHECTEEGADPPCVREKRCQLKIQKNEFGIKLYKICVNLNDLTLSMVRYTCTMKNIQLFFFSDSLENCPYATVKTYIIATVKISQTGLSN